MPKKPAAPKVVEKVLDVEIVEGKTARLDCVITGEPEPDIDWFFEGNLVKDEGRFKYLFEKGDVIGLEIKNVTVDDEGFYECVAKNKSGTAKSKGELLVNAPAKIVTKPDDASAKKGGSVSFKCKYDGNPKPDVAWYKGSSALKSGGRISISAKSQVGTLDIKDVTSDDAGEYSVEVSNDFGKTKSSFKLKFEDAGAPKPAAAAAPAAASAPAPKAYSAGLRAAKAKKKKLPVERADLKHENPENHYEFGDEIGQGKFSIVKKCIKKATGEQFAAKIIKFDDETLKFAIRELDIMRSEKFDHKGLVKLHDAYLVRKYLILIMDLAAGQTLLTYMAKRHSLTEEEVAHIIRQLLEILDYLHSNNFVHLDIRPTNIRMATVGSKEIKLLDYNSARMIANKMAGEVVDVIGDTEFCAPEMLQFDPVLPMSDMWSVGVIMYILLSGISPFYHEDEDEVLSSVQLVKYDKDGPHLEKITTEAKNFISKLLIRAPEMRMTAREALDHPWLADSFARVRKSSSIEPTDMKTTDERLYEEEEEEYIEASCVFRTFDEEEYESPEPEYEEDEE